MHTRSIPVTSVSRKLALLFAVACGMSVANIYYAHPLLDDLSREFGIAHSMIAIIMTATQICYALGLFLLVPLGDLLNRRLLIVCQMLLSVVALVVVGTASTSTVLIAGISVVGLLAVIVQTLVAYAATLAVPHLNVDV